MFNIEITKEMWKQITESVSTLLTEATFFITNSGLILSQLDASKAAMLKIDIPSSEFIKFKCTKEHIITLNVEILMKVLKRLTTAKSIIFKDKEKSEISIEVLYPNTKKIFNLPNFTTEMTTPRSFPEMPSDAEIIIETNTFKDAVKDVTIASAHVALAVKGKSLIVHGGSEGSMDSIGTTTITKPPEDAEEDESGIISIDVKNEITRTMYTTAYITEIMKGISADKLQMEISQNKPLVIYTWITSKAFIAFMIAPRVERR